MLRRNRKKKEPEENLDRWLLTYADMITLLLAFFVVMYSMSQVDAKRFGKMAEALGGILKGGSSVLDKYSEEQFKVGHGLLKLGNLRMIQLQVEKKFEELGRSEDIQTEVTERGLVVHVVESALFMPGTADLQLKSMEVLDLIYDKIKNAPNHIRVEGHTDDRSINTIRYPSNWELSSARATEVVRYFIDNYNVPPGKISALGYGQYRPVKPNNSLENRARNRRVDIVLLTMDLSMKEPTSQFYGLTGTSE